MAAHLSTDTLQTNRKNQILYNKWKYSFLMTNNNSNFCKKRWLSEDKQGPEESKVVLLIVTWNPFYPGPFTLYRSPLYSTLY